MRFGEIRHRSHGADVERLGVGAVHRVAGAQQAPVHVLGVAAHGKTLRHRLTLGIMGRTTAGRITEGAKCEYSSAHAKARSSSRRTGSARNGTSVVRTSPV